MALSNFSFDVGLDKVGDEMGVDGGARRAVSNLRSGFTVYLA